MDPRDAEDLALLVDAARAAGVIALRHFREDPETWEKDGGQGPVSEADLEVDRMLKAELGAARPDYGWLSEETDDSGARRKARLSAERVFICDPIDGTRAFLKGEETWGHALAVAQDGEVRAGVMFLPAREAMYGASRGGGATLNGAPLAPSSRTELTGADALVSAAGMRAERWKSGPPAVTRHFRASLCYRLCLVAQGRFDCSISVGGVWEWDAAAGDLILSEAGAAVSDARGERPRYNRPEPRLSGLIASAPGIHRAILDRLAPHD
ncbi:3'(2'),5'-bisphosphate nucleotidase CysQ [Albimonas sp. CAU 1670]|uniref:3'(2'),5'-bisphosphate nucleotidase CysQ n=1 Tax=Albimonas sp. CAU 1670 TaxID=3032599 RepID=UPI0023DAAB47|nr:3'(2'),5'-bisphosphate nucleotidase CysQ [Albimonas sp. CAU 1670]MDF2232829.1 3'(2'),5'-bisphosphate nucleotidase CysQ [Albimonas sp. CAU 1670]